jgi:hypothetical protein
MNDQFNTPKPNPQHQVETTTQKQDKLELDIEEAAEIKGGRLSGY